VATWARIDAAITCASCGGQTPLGRLELSGQVACAHCGAPISLPPQVWSQLLAQPQGVTPPYRDFALGGLSVRMTPGFPPCESCGAQVHFQQGAQISSTCTSCGRTVSYAAPMHARTLYPGIMAVLDPAHRIDAQVGAAGPFWVVLGQAPVARPAFVPSQATSDAGTGIAMTIVVIIGTIIAAVIAIAAQ